MIFFNKAYNGHNTLYSLVSLQYTVQPQEIFLKLYIIVCTL